MQNRQLLVTGAALNLQNDFETTAMLTGLCLPIHEHGMTFHIYLGFSLIYFNNILCFLSHNSYTSFAKLNSERFFFFFDAMNGIVF